MSDARRDMAIERTVAPRTGIALRDMTILERSRLHRQLRRRGFTHLFIPESGPKDRWLVEGRDPSSLRARCSAAQPGWS
jgi:hypothetical protein